MKENGRSSQRGRPKDLLFRIRELTSKPMRKIDVLLVVTLISMLVFASLSVLTVVQMPQSGEKFTEFYVLGRSGMAGDYPTNINVGQIGSVFVGIVNHEYKTVGYFVQIWQIEYSTQNEPRTIEHIFFNDGMNVTLDHLDVKVNEPWKKQWESGYNFTINRSGEYELAFVLFRDNVPIAFSNPEKQIDYANSNISELMEPANRDELTIRSLNVFVH